MGFNTNTENKDEWLTPIHLIESLGSFDLDPCSPHPDKRPWDTAKIHYHKDMNGLELPWNGRVWLNPPYGKQVYKWLEKLADHGSGIALIFARTDTRGFHEYVFNKASGIFFLKGRIKFYHVSGQQGKYPNASSCLVSYSKNDSIAILSANTLGKIKGKFIEIK